MLSHPLRDGMAVQRDTDEREIQHKPELDDYGRHEILHMASFLSRTVASELADHPQVKANAQWLALANEAGRALEALYQAVGATHLGDGDNIPKG